MKKIIALFAVAALGAALIGCGSSDTSTAETPAAGTSSTTTTTTPAAGAETPAAEK